MKLPVAPLLLAAVVAPGFAQSSSSPAPAAPRELAAGSAESGKKSPPLPRIYLGGEAAAGAKTEARPAAPARAPTTVNPGATAKAATRKTAKKDDAPGKIDGMEIGRGDKGFLGLRVVDGVFQLAFYDAKKKPVEPDVARATLRWTPNYKPGVEFYLLEASGDGKMLISPKTVRPPYNFKLFVSFFRAGSEEPVESMVVDFRQ